MPAQNSMLDGIRKEIKSFDIQLSKLKEFMSHGPFTYLSDRHKDSYASIDKYYKQLQLLVEKARAE